MSKARDNVQYLGSLVS